MSITLERYPILRVLHDFEGYSSLGLPLGGASKKGAKFAHESDRLKFLLNVVAKFSQPSTDSPMVNLFIDDQVYEELTAHNYHIKELDYAFIQEFMCGVICFDDHQLVYAIFSEDITAELLGQPDRYMAIAYFASDVILAFEEGFVRTEETAVSVDSRFEETATSDPGMYIGMVLAMLTHWKRKGKHKKVPPAQNKTEFAFYQY